MFGQGLTPQLGKERLSTGDLDELVHPADARNQRVVPLLEEDTRPVRQIRCAVRDLVQVLFEPFDERFCFGRSPDQRSDHADHLQDLGDAALIERDHRVAATDQLRGDVRLKI